MNGKDLHIGRLRATASCPPPRRSAIGALTIAGMAMAFAREGQGPRRALVHRRGRIVARRMARGDQSLRRAPAAGRLLRAEQSDRAVDAGSRAVRGPRVRRQGSRLRHSRHHDRRDRSGRDRGGVRLGGRARARRQGPGAHRAGLACACAATRTTTTCSISARIPQRRGSIRRSGPGLRRPRALRVLVDARSHPAYAAGSRPKALIAARRARRDEARGRGARRGAGALVIDAPWPRPPRRPARASSPERPPRPRVEVLDPAARPQRSTPTTAPALEAGPPFDRAATTFLEAVMLGVRDALRAGSARLRLRRGCRRHVRQRVPAAAAAARGVRRSDPELAARRRRGARRLRRRGAGRAAADRRDAVQRLRGHRLQPAREQRREDPLPLGRRRCRWSSACRGAASATPGRITARTPSRGSIAHRA